MMAHRLGIAICLFLVFHDGLATPAGAALVSKKSIPTTIQLRSRKASPSTFLRHRALDPVDVPLADFFLGTDLQ